MRCVAVWCGRGQCGDGPGLVRACTVPALASGIGLLPVRAGEALTVAQPLTENSMATSLLPSAARPQTGAKRARRLTTSFLGRGHAGRDLAVRLHGVLPLRYPSSALDPTRDPLTGLGSQPAFVASLESRAASFEREGTPYSLLLIDIDHLGFVNARNGSVEGDELLKGVAELMLRFAQPGQSHFRIGGDEFAIIMSDTRPDEAFGHAAQVLEALEHPRGDSLPGTFSAAVVASPWTAGDPEVLYRQALEVLADVKRNGRAGVGVFQPERHRLPDPGDEDLVERILTDGSLRPVFQPIIELRSGRVIGYEGLVRSDAGGPRRGTRELFAAAGAAGRMAQLDLACIEVIVNGARAISADRLLTINLSPGTMAGREFEPAWLVTSLVQAGISPSRVIVELSDDAPVDDLGRLQRSFHELQQSGLRLAADDVAIDDPERRLMSHVPFDIVKIDLSQVWEGAQSGPRLAVLRDTALSRHARVVAEGVETSEQLLAVRDLEFGAGQGYLLGRPDAVLDGRGVDMRRLEAEADSVWATQDSVRPPDAALPDALPAEGMAVFVPPAPAPERLESRLL